MRKGPNKVCINTDDAGIMPTTLRTEFNLLEQTALQFDVSPIQAQDWVTRLRQFGLDEFNRTHQKVIQPLNKQLI